MAEFTVENIAPIHIFDTLLDAAKHESDLTACEALKPRASEIFDEMSAAGDTPDWKTCYKKALAELKNLRMSIYSNRDMDTISININHLEFPTRAMILDPSSIQPGTMVPFTVKSSDDTGVAIHLDCESIGKYSQNELKNCVTVARFFNASVIKFTYKDNLSSILRLY